MNKALLLITLGTLLTPSLTAQGGPPAPAPQLQKFAPMLGNWEGEGVVVNAPGEPEMPWTAIQTVTSTLNGHVIQDDLRVNLGEGMPPFIMRTLHGWDPSKQSLYSYQMGNMGSNHNSSIDWIDKNTVVSVSHGIDQGQPFADRWVTTFSGDSYTFSIDRAMGAAPSFTHVKGTFKRSNNTFSAAAAEASAAVMLPPSEEIQKLAPMIGDYEITGFVIPMPGIPQMEITGQESADWMFGGSVLATNVHGQPSDYEGWGYLYWDMNAKCYVQFMVDNMGGTTVSQGHWTPSGELVLNLAGSQYGMPMVARTIVKMNDENGMIKAVTDQMNATGEATRSFEGNYTRK